MKESQASRTAEYAAAFRALETTKRPARARLFEDRFAVHFLSPEKQRLVRWSSLPFLGHLLRYYIDRRWPGAMTSGIARTRLIDDLLLAAIRNGIRQILILGAGFDCRAYRLPELAGCRIVEIDHPATQQMKREILSRIIGVVPDRVAFVSADLTQQGLHEVLETAGLAWEQSTFILWEGVTHYLGEAAVDATLRVLSTMLVPGSHLLFTYLHGGLLDGTADFDGSNVSRERVAGDGEPWIWGKDPALLPDFLADRGYRLLEDFGANEYRIRYWGDRGRRMHGFAFYRVALAEINFSPGITVKADMV